LATEHRITECAIMADMAFAFRAVLAAGDNIAAHVAPAYRADWDKAKADYNVPNPTVGAANAAMAVVAAGNAMAALASAADVATRNAMAVTAGYRRGVTFSPPMNPRRDPVDLAQHR
jgi:hypothetical protein